MTVSTSLLAYLDCTSLLDQALADDKGARLKVEDMDEASHQRMRIHYARKLHRDENAKTYEAGHPMHGRSEYDKLTCRIRNVNGDIYIYLERTDSVKGKIEPLSEVDDEPAQIAHEPMKQIGYGPGEITEVKDIADIPAIVQEIVRRRV